MEDGASWVVPLKHLDNAFAPWPQQHLPYHGRALVVNTLGLSIFWYLLSFLPMPRHVLQAINTVVFSFIWQQKGERLSCSSITQCCSQSGLNVRDVEHKVSSGLHVKWVGRLVESPDHPSLFFFQHSLQVAFAGRTLQQILNCIVNCN